ENKTQLINEQNNRSQNKELQNKTSVELIEYIKNNKNDLLKIQVLEILLERAAAKNNIQALKIFSNVYGDDSRLYIELVQKYCVIGQNSQRIEKIAMWLQLI